MSALKKLLDNKNSELNKLFKKPVKEKQKYMGHFHVREKNFEHMMDLLQLPLDDGYNYLLVIVDIATRLIDCEAVKQKDAYQVLLASEKIYKRKILKIPNVIAVDAGTEFKGVFKKHYEEKEDVHFKVALSNRHRQQGPVEIQNKMIGEYLHKLMVANETVTIKENLDWVHLIPDLVKYMNDKRIAVLKKEDKLIDKGKKDHPNDFTFHPQKGYNIIYEVGTKVRLKVQKDEPVSYFGGEKLYGNIRAGDIKYHPDLHEITEVIMYPDQPVFYILDKNPKVMYTSQQFQVVENENEVEGELVQKLSKKKLEDFRVSKIMDSKTENRKKYYLVKWYGFPDKKDWSWEPATKLPKEEIKKYLDSE